MLLALTPWLLGPHFRTLFRLCSAALVALNLGTVDHSPPEIYNPWKNHPLFCFPLASCTVPRLRPSPVAPHTGYTHTWCLLSISLFAVCSCLWRLAHCRAGNTFNYPISMVRWEQARRGGWDAMCSHTCHHAAMYWGGHDLGPRWTGLSNIIFSKRRRES